MKKSHSIIIRSVLLTAIAMPALAADQGYYFGAKFGETGVKDIPSVPDLLDDADLDFNITITDEKISSDDKDSAYSFFIGRRFNPNFAVEVAYIDLGEASTSYAFDAINHDAGDAEVSGAVNISTESKGFSLVALGAFPVTDAFSIYGKLGGYYGQTDGTLSASGLTEPLSGSEDKKGASLIGGLGLEYAFRNGWSIRGEYERYFDVKSPLLETDIDVISLGLVYTFPL
ncbi:MAG: outer membrane beta-barrel protein [Pseudomonadales bacterium]